MKDALEAPPAQEAVEPPGLKGKLAVYGVVRRDDCDRAMRRARELDSDADALEAGSLAAIVSRRTERRRRVREALVRHSAVLESVAAEVDVLPMRYGVMADEATVRTEILEARVRWFEEAMHGLAGRVEMRVIASYDRDAVLFALLKDDPAVRQRQRRIRERPDASTYWDKVELGRAVAGALERRRAADANRLLQALRPISFGVQVAAPATETTVLVASFLVGREDHASFAGTAEGLGLDERHLRVRARGPLPPWSFVPNTGLGHSGPRAK
jgi:hypothetical protein